MTNAAKLLEDNPSEELRELHKKREALEKVVKITQALERMLNGLQAVLLLGQPSAKISKRALRAYEQLNNKTAMLPTAQLKIQLDRLDKLVSGTVRKILEISSIDHHHLDQHINHHADEITAVENKTGLLIDNFRRSAQTAVALRILLRERGVSTPAMDFKISDTELHRQLSQLDEREQQCRHQIEDSICEIQKSTQRIIDSKTSSDEVKAIASMIQENLKRDLKHIKDGKSIDDMPMVVEVVELKDDQGPDEESAQQKNPAEKNIKNSAAAQDNSQGVAQTKTPAKLGFLGKLRVWGTTPLDVKWKDIGED